ncbi:CDP-glycerol glycerophosphotransferase family protein [Pediococcus parvulus]|uniref:CDP-glycerol glycerophosphotransferase family protein n=1 Tax=Pediococcus parvulus TaxID=54062 RepID=UPI00345E1482
MKKFIMNHKIVSFVFLYIVKISFFLMHFFIKVDDNLVLFTSFSGRNFNDSPKTIFEALRQDKEFENFRYVWGFKKYKENFKWDQVKTSTWSYFITLIRAKYWISNSSIDQLVPINSKKHVYINTWHGVPLKFLGKDEKRENFLTKNWYQKVQFDLLLSSGEYDNKLFHRIFPSCKNIQITGLPRNICLSDASNKQKALEYVSKKITFDKQKKTILYAPTFRAKSINNRGVMTLPFSKKALKRLSEQYNFLVRPHYFVEKIVPVNSITDVRELDLNNLMQVSDILITDYSSIMFDYLNLNKPIILYTYDMYDYIKNNGTYINPNEIGFPVVDSSEDLIIKIQEVLKQEYNQTVKIREKFNVFPNVSVEVVKNFIKSH